MLRLLWDFLFPPYCVNCGKFDSYVCDDCFDRMYWYDQPVAADINRPSLDRLYPTTIYKSTGMKLVKAVKFRLATDVVHTMAEMMAEVLNRPEADLLTCVPLHHKRELNRGFNQAELLARAMSLLWQIPYLPLLSRNRATAPQADLDRDERLENLKLAFEFRSDMKISGQRIVIIDDVSTTGATLNECAKVLKQHHAKHVEGVVFAHG